MAPKGSSTWLMEMTGDLKADGDAVKTIQCGHIPLRLVPGVLHPFIRYSILFCPWALANFEILMLLLWNLNAFTTDTTIARTFGLLNSPT